MKSILLIICLAAITFSSQADSPLTSTPFSDAYSNTKMVTYAKEKGYNKKVVKFLAGKSDIVSKLAVINSFGFGKVMTKDFETYLIKKRKGVTAATFEELRIVPNSEPSETEITKGLTADDLACWAYMIAMEDYQNPKYAMKASFFAQVREPNSMGHVLPYALTSAQVVFDIDWCQVYVIPNELLVEKKYDNNNLSEEALKIIMDYIDLYEGDCNKEE